MAIVVPTDNRIMVIKKTKQNWTNTETLSKIVMELEDDSDTDNSRSPRNNPKESVKRLEKLEIRGRIEIVQTTTLLRSAGIRV